MDVSGNYTFDAPQPLVWEALQDPNVLGAILPGGKGITQVAENEYDGVLQIKVGPVQGTFQGHIKLSDITAPVSYNIHVDGKGAPGFVKATGGLKLEARGEQTYMEYSGSAQIGGKIASVGQRLIDSSARSIIRQALDALNAYLKVKVAEAPAAPPPLPAAQPAAQAAPAAGDNPDFDKMSPEEIMKWMESLEKRQGAPVAEAASPEPAAQPASAPTPAAPPKIELGSYKPPSQMQLMMNVARDVFNDMVPAQVRPWLIGAVVVILLLLIYAILPK
jgi:uncharacterized protein